MTSVILQHLGRFLYLVDPDATTFQDPKRVPDYVHEAVPFFTLLMFIELAVHYLQGKDLRLNSILCSASIGIIHLASEAVFGFMMLVGYEWLYERRLMDISWDSRYTWIAAFIMVDFCFYWLHRADHEINFLWAVHQVHHSSEDFNLSVAMRNSILMRIVAWGFYQPLALLGFPLSTVMVHTGLNLVSQFWLHTDLIKTLGPIEWIFNTPSHHRVHHGANNWCLDKNYSGVFIIWDRLFGTFQAEKCDQDICYGLTDQPQTFNALWHQFYYFVNMYHKARGMKTWGNVLKVIFYGPGWNPGTPRLGDTSTSSGVETPRPKYDNKLHVWQIVYLSVHLSIAAAVQYLLFMQIQNQSWMSKVMYQAFVFAAVGSVSFMCDGWKWAPMAEATRCAFFVAYGYIYPITNISFVDTLITGSLAASVLIWVSHDRDKGS